MLIVLDDNIIDDINDSIIQSLQNIAECIKNGRHIIYANRDLLEKICKLKDLNEINRRCFQTMRHKITQYGSIKDSFKTYIHVVGNLSKIEFVKNGENCVYKVPIELLGNTANLQKTRLICEDLSDCEFYKALAVYCMERQGINVNIDFEYVNGGGMNIGSNYREKLQSNYSPLLAIIDSDKIDENESIGQTAQNIRRIYDASYQENLTMIHILDVRERENLIPPQIYYELEEKQTVKNHFSILVDLYNSKYKNLYLYGDIKSGLQLNDDNVKSYIREELENLIVDDFTLDDIIKLKETLQNFFGENKLISVLKEYCDASKETSKDRLICGVRKSFITFKAQILDNGYGAKIQEKKDTYDSHPNDRIKGEITNLEHKLECISNTISDMPDEFKKYWGAISYLCYQWGAKISIAFV